MANPQIVIDVSGESAGSPGVARSFSYPKISPTPPTVTLSLASVSGITAFYWEILDQPDGASASLSDSSAASPTFVPTANIPGTYLIQCTVNNGSAYARNAVAFLTPYQGIRLPAAGETLEFSATDGWKIALNAALTSLEKSGGKLGSPPYGEAALLSESVAGNYTLLAAPGSGKVRRVGLGLNSSGSGVLHNDDGVTTQTATLKVGGLAVYYFEVDPQEQDYFPYFFLPAGDALTVDLDESVATMLSISWCEHDDTDFGASVITVDDTWTTLIEPPASGKIFAPASFGEIGYLGGFNRDDISHGYSLRLYDGANAYPLFITPVTWWSTLTFEQFYSPWIPLSGDLRLQVKLNEAVNSVAPVVWGSWAILDEQ